MHIYKRIQFGFIKTNVFILRHKFVSYKLFLLFVSTVIATSLAIDLTTAVISSFVTYHPKPNTATRNNLL